MKLKVAKNIKKGKSLTDMAIKTLERLNETDRFRYPSNTLIDYYCVIHKLMEAISLSEGIKFKGEGTHQKLIDYISEIMGFDEKEKLFIQKARALRHRISYEGFTVHENFIRLNEHMILEIIKSLQ